MKVKELFEKRRSDLEYKNKVMKNVIERVTAELEGNESGVFTRAAKRYKQMDRLLAAIQEKRNELNEDIKSEVLSYFDGAADEIYTRVIDTVSLTATVSKKQADTPASKESTVDYAAVVKKLLELVPDIEEQAKKLVEEFTTVVDIPAKPGKSPSLSVKFKDEDEKKARMKSKADALIDEGVGDVVKSLLSKLKSFLTNFKSWGKDFDKKLNEIRVMIKYY